MIAAPLRVGSARLMRGRRQRPRAGSVDASLRRPRLVMRLSARTARPWGGLRAQGNAAHLKEHCSSAPKARSASSQAVQAISEGKDVAAAWIAVRGLPSSNFRERAASARIILRCGRPSPGRMHSQVPRREVQRPIEGRHDAVLIDEQSPRAAGGRLAVVWSGLNLSVTT